MNRKTIYREEAIPLIYYEQETSKYVINEDALEILQNIPAPIGVVGVAGMYRTGKSYLLNRMLLNRSDGFGVGPTVNPCTKGLWIWGKPLLGQTAEGENCSILVIDSEGLGALDEDSTHDTRIFSLVILLSSCFIYNSVGSIDENAIQNLSLVVNLTKNIQIKASQQLGSEVEDFSQYFPSFFWVVRDFTLQLVDQDGETISSKEYLERAMQIQKGFSEGVEQKNRVRRLLSTFFKERDCITLVRPLTKEENLQNLEKMDFDKLRPEFFEQVIQLRKRVLNRIKPKILNGRPLSGSMYCDLIRAFISAINQGAVPAIESAWTYICRNECQKALADAFECYEIVLKDLLHGKLPLPSEDLKGYSKMSKDQALAAFKKRKVGDDTLCEEYTRELSRRIKTRLHQVSIENDREGLRNCMAFIQGEFSAIDRKLKLGEYNTFMEYEKDIRLFYNYFMENGPRTTNRQSTILEFLQKALAEGGTYFSRLLALENEQQRQQLMEQQKKLELDLKESRAEGLKDKNNLLMKLAQLEADRAEVEMREQVLKENLATLKVQKEKSENDLNIQATNEKNEMLKQLQEMKQKLINVEENSRQTERSALLGNSEFEKEKALLTQRIQYLEKIVEEGNKRERDFQQELKTQKLLFTQQQKELQTKLDQVQRGLQQRISDLQERASELETEVSETEARADNETQKFITKEQALLKQNNDLNEQLQQVLRELNSYRISNERLVEQRQSDLSSADKQKDQRLQELEDLLRIKEDALKQSRNLGEKDKALLQQKCEFMELQLLETKQQLDENRKAHEAIMKAFENSSLETSNRFDSAKVNEIREQHKREVKALENEIEQQRKKLQFQIDQLNERNSELELKVKFETGDLLKEIEGLKEQLANSEDMKIKLVDQCKSLDGSKLALLKEQESRFNKRIRQLEALVEDAENKTAREVQASQAKAEESLAQLKNFYEIERERLERRICEEKEKSDKRYQALNEEYYAKMKECESQYEEELEALKEDLREQDVSYQGMIQQYEHELALKQQNIETLEKYIRETKESLISLQNSNNSTLEQQMNSFTTERKGLIAKIDALTTQLSQLQKEHMALQQRRDLLEGEKQRKEAQLDQARKDWVDERKELIDKAEDAKQRLQNLNDDFLEKKIEFGRDMALTQQQNEFLQKKIDDLQKQIDIQSSRYEEKLKLLKTEYVTELAEKLERSQEEKNIIDAKYDRIKKQLKESEATLTRQLAQLEREKAIITEKLQNSESKRAELEYKVKDENALTLQQTQVLKEQLSQEKRQLSTELDRYKQLNLSLEQEKNEIVTSYERDRALWEGKFQFLEQQKEQAKQDLVDALKKFEMTLMHLQRARNNEKDEQESNLNELLISVERKYQAQIEEANQTHQRVIQDYEDKLRRLQKELKQQKDKQLIDQHGKLGNQLLTEKKFAEMLENEKRLQQEIEQVKQERDIKLVEYQKQFENERDSLKYKINELEQKYKEVENRRSCLIFEFEKERAKWNLDKDHLNNVKNELTDALDKAEKRKELLLRENEKLKNEQRATRRSVNHNMTSHTLLTGNKYKQGVVNNVSTIGLSKQQLSPTHSNNTSTSSANISVLGNQGMNKKTYAQFGSQQPNLTDITNFSGIQPYDPSRPNKQSSFFVLGDESQKDDSRQDKFTINFKN